jgi:hypothetical protein
VLDGFLDKLIIGSGVKSSPNGTRRDEYIEVVFNIEQWHQYPRKFGEFPGYVALI